MRKEAWRLDLVKNEVDAHPSTRAMVCSGWTGAETLQFWSRKRAPQPL